MISILRPFEFHARPNALEKVYILSSATTNLKICRRNGARSIMFLSVIPRAQAGLPFEKVAELALLRVSAKTGDFRDTEPRVVQMALGFCQPGSPDFLPGRPPVPFHELRRKCLGRKPHRCGHLANCDPFAGTLGDDLERFPHGILRKHSNGRLPGNHKGGATQAGDPGSHSFPRVAGPEWSKHDRQLFHPAAEYWKAKGAHLRLQRSPQGPGPPRPRECASRERQLPRKHADQASHLHIRSQQVGKALARAT